MKNIIYGIVMAVIGVLIVLVLLTVNGKMTRQAELDDSLASAVENALDNCLNKKNYDIGDNKEFVADFNQELLTQIENDADIEVQLTKVDKTKGVLGIKVKEIFKNPNGKEAEQTYETSACLDKDRVNKYYNIIFMDKDNTVLNASQLKGNSLIKAPKMPDNFKCWVDKDTNEEITELGRVAEDKTYIAKYN